MLNGDQFCCEHRQRRGVLTYRCLGLYGSCRPLFLLLFQLPEECSSSCSRLHRKGAPGPDCPSSRAFRAGLVSHEPQLLALGEKTQPHATLLQIQRCTHAQATTRCTRTSEGDLLFSPLCCSPSPAAPQELAERVRSLINVTDLSIFLREIFAITTVCLGIVGKSWA